MGAHERLADEEATIACSAQPVDGGRIRKATLRDAHDVVARGQQSGHAQRVFGVGGEATEVTVVDADHIHLWADVPQLVGRMQLQKHL